MSRHYAGTDATWTRTVDPVDDPVDLEEFKASARIVQANNDATLQLYLALSTETAEAYLGHGLLTQTWRLELHRFADAMFLPMAYPLQSVSTVTYYDADGALQTLSPSAYDVDATSRPGRVLRHPATCWPALQCDRDGARVFITYVVGWTDADDVPERIKQGIRLYASAQDVDRDGSNGASRLALEDAAKRCWDDRVGWIEPIEHLHHMGHHAWRRD